jgi:hypothetical protein
MIIKCQTCGNDFEGKKTRKYCGHRCAGLAKVPGLILRNKARRKYEPVEGLTRNQLYWRNNRDCVDKHLARDMNKRIKVINYLGGKCVNCGFDKDFRALVLDHIHGDGKEDRKQKGSRLYRYYSSHLSDTQSKLQVLCANCNLIKSFDNKEHNISRRVIKTGDNNG